MMNTEEIKVTAENWGKSRSKVEAENLTKALVLQQQNPLYLQADILHRETKEEQLIKAAAKYPEPLNPHSWTGLELTKHAFQELIDLEHYITALHMKVEALENLRDVNYSEYAELSKKYQAAQGAIEMLKDDLQIQQERNEDLQAMYNRSYELNKSHNVRIGELLEENKNLKAANEKMAREVTKVFNYGR